MKDIGYMRLKGYYLYVDRVFNKYVWWIAKEDATTGRAFEIERSEEEYDRHIDALRAGERRFAVVSGSAQDSE